MTMLTILRDAVGRERDVRGLGQALHLAVAEQGAPSVGAMHVTCADESEHECARAFRQTFAQYLLPDLKSAHPSPMRLATLGGRYEWGAVGIAEQHYATQGARGAWTLLVVKVNAHVAVTETRDGLAFGLMERYGRGSACCGALAAVLDGDVHPFAAPLHEALTSEGLDRLATLRDPARVDPAHRSLFAALASARLQARAVMLDIEDHVPTGPTLYVVLPCVTLNRTGPDGEILCGGYVADRRAAPERHEYFGLGDDPALYRLETSHGRVVVRDPGVDVLRPTRDHRRLVLSTWKAHGPEHARALADARIERIRRDAAVSRAEGHEHARMLLQALLLVLAEIAPVPAAVLLFGTGAAGIHHAFRAHRIARREAEVAEARQVVREIHDRVDRLGEEETRALLDELLDGPAPQRRPISTS